MCGIIGYTGEEQAAPLLLDGLSRLAYRGYDSAGIVVQSPKDTPSHADLGLDSESLPPVSACQPLQVAKTQGKLPALQKITKQGKALRGCCGLGHTRWATHGSPTAKNAHPHLSMDGCVAVVHNGIIENHGHLREVLEREGYVFVSDTDTEVVAHLIERAFAKQDPTTPLAHEIAIAEVVRCLEGNFALGILFAHAQDTLYAVAYGNPLVVGQGQDAEGVVTSGYVASDMAALLPYTRKIRQVEAGILVKITPKHLCFYDMTDEGGEIRDVTLTQPPPREIPWDASSADKGEHPHFMYKEIYEQPTAMASTLSPCLKQGSIDLSGIGLDKSFLSQIEQVVFIGCGSAYHVARIGKHWIETLCGLPSMAELASEFRYHPPVMLHPHQTLAVCISQSGETADTLGALRHAKEMGMPTLGILNVAGSTMAREADHILLTHAGLEVSVATTKAYTAQLMGCIMLSLALGGAKGRIPSAQYTMLTHELCQMPNHGGDVLMNTADIVSVAKRLKNARDVYFLGRGLDWTTAEEGSLKLKEISYIHAEAYAAGELKHGSISLMEDGVPVVALATQPHLYPKMLSAMSEVGARGAEVFCLTNSQGEDLQRFSQVADHVLTIPETSPLLSPMLAVMPLQLLSYHTALCRGMDIDQPRHLAKSVTVE